MSSVISGKYRFVESLQKSILLALSIASVIMGSLFLSAQVNATEKPIGVFLDGKEVKLEIEPNQDQGTTLVQMRPLFEALDIKLTWNASTKGITAEKEGLSISMVLDSDTAVINGKQVKLNRPATSIHGHTVVPLRFISEATGALVHWNSTGREILVLTEPFIASLGMTVEEMKEFVEKTQNEIDEKYKKQTPDPTGNKDQDTPPDSKLTLEKVDQNKLKGMYYGFEPDLDGYKCGGMCWKFYTFLSDNRIVIGQPVNGGKETIDCKVDKCQTYTIKDKQLVTNGGQTLSIGQSSKGYLYINQAQMTLIEPVPNDLKLDGEYIHRGYSGLVGISPGATSWSRYMTFYSNGSFETESNMIGVLTGGGSHTSGSTSSDPVKGTYTIHGNTITLKYEDGQQSKHVFVAEAADKKDGQYLSIQIGDRNFDLKD